MTRRTRYSPEVRERAIRLVHEQRGAHASEWAAVTSIACKIWRKASVDSMGQRNTSVSVTYQDGSWQDGAYGAAL